MLNNTHSLAPKIADALERDTRTQNSSIEVHERGGKITLRGSVASTLAAHAAREIANGFNGVLYVLMDLTVASPRQKMTT